MLYIPGTTLDVASTWARSLMLKIMIWAWLLSVYRNSKISKICSCFGTIIRAHYLGSTYLFTKNLATYFPWLASWLCPSITVVILDCSAASLGPCMCNLAGQVLTVQYQYSLSSLGVFRYSKSEMDNTSGRTPPKYMIGLNKS